MVKSTDQKFGPATVEHRMIHVLSLIKFEDLREKSLGKSKRQKAWAKILAENS